MKDTNFIHHEKQSVVCGDCLKVIHKLAADIDDNRKQETVVKHCQENHVLAAVGVLNNKIINWTLMGPIDFNEATAQIVKAFTNKLSIANNSTDVCKNFIKH